MMSTHPHRSTAHLQRHSPTARAPAPITGKTYLRQRRRQILADTATLLMAGDDPDTIVLPALHQALAAERIVDASLGFVVTEMEEGMRLGFIKGFPKHVIQRCLTLDFGQAIAGPSPPRASRCTSRTSSETSIHWPTSCARPGSTPMPASR
jgi:hypothetical protein